MVVALCVLGVFAFLLTTCLVVCCSFIPEMFLGQKRREKKKMNNFKTNLAKNGE